MKKIGLLFSFFVASLTIFGQSLTLSYSGGVIPDGGSIIWTTPANTPILSGQKNIFVHNIGASDADVLCAKEVVDTISGTKNAFCWGACYGDDIYTPSTPLFIATGDSTDIAGFSGDYSPNGHEGDTHIRYIFTNTNNHESVSVVVTYRATPVSVNSYTQNISKLNMSPNPASTQSTIDYSVSDASGNLTLVVKNLLGAVIYTTDLSSTLGKTSINTSDYTDGIYFVSILSDNRPMNTKKLIVRH